MQNCFDDLKRAWEGRKGELEARLRALGGAGLFGGGGYGGMYGGGPAQQYAQLEQVSLFFRLWIRCHAEFGWLIARARSPTDGQRGGNAHRYVLVCPRAVTCGRIDQFLVNIVRCTRYYCSVILPDARGLFWLPAVERHRIQAKSARIHQRRTHEPAGLAAAPDVLKVLYSHNVDLTPTYLWSSLLYSTYCFLFTAVYLGVLDGNVVHGLYC